MQKRSSLGIRITIIAFSLGLIAFVFLKGKNNPTALINETSLSSMESGFEEIDFEYYRLNLENNLTIEQTAELASATVYGNTEDGLFATAMAWDRIGYPEMAAYYFEQAAENFPSEANWQKAADKYFEVQKIAADTSMFMSVVHKSIKAFNKVLEINPTNIDAKADLAVCYIEGTRDVMHGVGILREILEVDPDHQKSIFYLGVLSIQSGQYARALERFEHLVSLQPENPFHYYYLGQIQLALNNKPGAIEALNQYKHLVQNTALKEDAERLILNIRNN